MRRLLTLLVLAIYACSAKTNSTQSSGGTGTLTSPVGGASVLGGMSTGTTTPQEASGGQLGGSGGASTSSSSSPSGGVPDGTGGSNTPTSIPCVSDATTIAYQTSGSGMFSGTDVDGFICTGGAIAYMERTQASSYVGSQLLVIIDTALTGTPSTRLQFNKPSNATGGMLTIMAGVGAAAPGTYSSSNGTSCGSLAFCVYLPLPTGVTCPDEAGACKPPYCAMQGPVMGPTCQPVTPEVCYEVKAASSCLPDSQSPLGSWTMTLTSVTPYVSDAGSSGMSYYIVHGSFAATMVEDQSAADAGMVTANLTITF